jgi:hypothetical protein
MKFIHPLNRFRFSASRVTENQTKFTRIEGKTRIYFALDFGGFGEIPTILGVSPFWIIKSARARAIPGDSPGISRAHLLHLSGRIMTGRIHGVGH